VKLTTPKAPKRSPCVFGETLVTLLSILMSKGNTYASVIKELRAAATAGEPGSRLPSVRELMARHGAGPATVQRAVGQLVREGLVEARSGRGSFVARQPEDPLRSDLGWQSVALGERRVSADGLGELLGVLPEGAIPLTFGYLSEDLQPLAQLATAMARSARRPGVWGRIPTEGLEGLRAWFAREVGSGARAHDVLVTPGGQAALSTLFRALVAPGSPVLFESPTYVGALVAARSARLRPVPVPTDADGVRPDLLGEAFAASGARIFYCQPTYANPHGVTLSPDRRDAVLEAARAAGAFVVEDDPSRDLALGDAPPPPLASRDPDGHVIYLRSLTKAVAPGLRIAGLCARGAAGARLKAARVVDDFFVSGALQETALELLSSPAWRRHRRRVRSELAARRNALVEVVRERLPQGSLASVPRGGLHLWLGLPDEVYDVRVAAEAGRRGVVVSPGRHWFPAEPNGSFLRISYTGADANTLAEGITVLAGVVREATGAP
jgi:DNA-binding transcriptional MocR family regulator